MRVFMRRQQYREARNRHSNRYEREQKAMFEEIRKVSNNKRENERGRPRRHGVQLRADLAVAVGFDDAGGEECVAVSRDDEPEIHQAAEEELVVFEAVEDVAEGDLAFAGGAALVFVEASADVGAFVVAEPGERVI